MLRIGKLIKIEIPAIEDQNTFDTSILGEEDEHLLVRGPNPVLNFKPPATGSRLIIHHLEEGGILQVETAFVTEQPGEPYTLWRIVKPGTFELRGSVKRKHQRSDTDMSATLEPFGRGVNPGTKVWAELLDISSGGALIGTRQTFSIGQRMFLRFQLGLQGRQLSLRARIVRDAGGEGLTHQYGVEFIDPPQKARSDIKAFQTHLRNHPPQNRIH